jgi:hypothetical protein
MESEMLPIYQVFRTVQLSGLNRRCTVEFSFTLPGRDAPAAEGLWMRETGPAQEGFIWRDIPSAGSVSAGM